MAFNCSYERSGVVGALEVHNSARPERDGRISNFAIHVNNASLFVFCPVTIIINKWEAIYALLMTSRTNNFQSTK
jgi:hypothetical protein